MGLPARAGLGDSNQKSRVSVSARGSYLRGAECTQAPQTADRSEIKAAFQVTTCPLSPHVSARPPLGGWALRRGLRRGGPGLQGAQAGVLRSSRGILKGTPSHDTEPIKDSYPVIILMP